MSEIYVNGGKRLNGSVKIQGSKNSVLPILAATLLCEGECLIKNCPDLSDVDECIKILEHLGCTCKREDGTLTVDTSVITGCEIPYELMRTMRSSVVFLGAILGRCKRAVIYNPGGCELGPRPIDLHISALKRLGATLDESHGQLIFEAESGLKGCEINLAFPSVGATENIMLGAALCEGITVIKNAAREPEIVDLAEFLNRAGGAVYGAGYDTVVIHGKSRLHGVEHTVIPDRIVAATYMAACAITGGDISLKGVIPSHISSCISTFRDAGCNVECYGDTLRIKAPEKLLAVPCVRSLVYPGFPTDAGPIFIAMLSVAKGTSVFVENVFESRYKYIDELVRLGAHIRTEGKVAIIDGVDELWGSTCECCDLRAGAALVVAALKANSITDIKNISHIRRGYDDITGCLSALGADIYEK